MSRLTLTSTPIFIDDRIYQIEDEFKAVQLESPYRGNNYEHTEFNVAYANACIRDCLLNGEAPFASHIQYTNATDDKNANERKLGIEAGLHFLNFAKYTVVYTDLGITSGMKQGIKKALSKEKNVYYRKLPNFQQFLNEHKHLLNGYSHIVGKEREYTLRDELVYDIQFGKLIIDLKMTNYMFFRFNHKHDFDSYLTDDLDFIYPVSLKEKSESSHISYGIGGCSYEEKKSIEEIIDEYHKAIEPIKQQIDKWKLNRKLKNQLTTTKKEKVKKI